MSTTNVDQNLRAAIGEVVADILEIDAAELSDTNDFQDDYGADSMKGIEVLAALERQFGITIDQSELGRMTNLAQVREVVYEAMGKR